MTAGILLAMALGHGGAQVHAAPRRVGVVKFVGPGEAVTRALVMKALKTNRVQVIGGDQIEQTARKQRVSLGSPAGFEVLARSLGLTAIVTGEVARQKATLSVRNGSGGAIVDSATWAAPDPRKLAASVGRTFWKRLGPAIDRSKAPSGAKLDVAPEDETLAVDGEEGSAADEAPPEPPPKAAPKAAAAPPSGKPAKRPAPATVASSDERDQRGNEGESEDDHGKARSTDDDEESEATPTVTKRAARAPASAPVEQLDEGLSLSFGPRYGMRSLSYVDDRYQMNSNYSLPRSPLVGVDADFFPAALSGRGVAGSFGLTGSFEYQLPFVKSKFYGGGPSYTTNSLAWSVGLKVRLPVGFYLTSAVGAHFSELVDKDTAVPSDVPQTNYQFIRGGLGVRRRLSRVVMMMAHGAYLHCLKLGQIGGAGYYPRATGAGWEAGAAFGFLVSPHLEVRAGADVQRFALAFNVKLGDALTGARTAGGAVDQYASAWVALAFLIAPGAGAP